MGFLFGSGVKTQMVSREDALPGRSSSAYQVPTTHTVLGTPLAGPWPAGICESGESLKAVKNSSPLTTR